ncbi:MAG: ABC transporter permease [Gammaproteobacteria bacterium]
MRTVDLLAFCINALRRHGFRTFMMFIAMSIGVAAVIVLTGLGEGARRYVLKEFESLGTNILIVLPGKQETSGGMPPMTGEATRDLTFEDSVALTHIPQVQATAPLIIGSALATQGGRAREVVTLGTTPHFFSIRKLTMAQGSILPPESASLALPVAVLGQTVRAELFGTQPAVGQTFRLGDRRFRVIGILADSGEGMGMNRSESIIIPVASAQQLFNSPGLFRVFIETRPGANLDTVRERALRLIAERHDGEEDVTIITQDALVSSFNDILTALTLAVSAIGAISLLVAAVLVMNVTLITVTQRTAEIGLLKAIGASGNLVSRIFLTEAGLMTLSGAIGGVLLGEALLWAGRRLFPDIPFAAPLWAEVTAVVVAVVAGLLFALMPARRAARLEPVNALMKK